MPYDDSALDRFKALHPKLIDLSLDRMLRLLADLGHPHRRLPPAVHVAGTNGKGSLVAYLKAIAEAAGYRAHVYTSPALVRFNERIVLAGHEIDDATLTALVARVEAVNAGRPITLFEITTAIAFLAFAEHPADILLLETGLGGRLDATNVIERPLLTAITPVSIDHQDFLGQTLTEIAGEKAGILKPGVPVVLGRQSAEGLAVLEAKAAALGCPVDRLGRDWTAVARNTGLRFEKGDTVLDLPTPALAGPHQIENAGTAIACALRLRGRFDLPDRALARGLETVQWPARMQPLTRGPLVEAFAPGALWLDGGHNADGAAAIAATLAAWGGPPLPVAMAMLDTKDPVAFLGPLTPHIAKLRTVAMADQPRSYTAERLAEIARGLGIDAAPATDLREAVGAAAGAPRMLICGSLYLAGAVLAENG